MAGRFTVEAVFEAADRFTRPIGRMQSKLQRFSRSARRSLHQVNGIATGLLRGFRAVGIAAVAAGAVAGVAMANLIRTGAEFEQTLASAAAKFPGQVRRGTEAFAALQEAAAEVGSTTEFTAAQAAEGLDFLAMAGFNAEQAISALPGVVDLATAAQVELGTATDIATDSLGAFGLMTDDAAQLGQNLARVNDVIARTTTSANTTVEAMFEAIRTGAPVATAAGQSLETFAALTGELANAGIKGSESGTALRNMFLRLQAPASKGSRALRRMGIEVADGQGNMRDMIDILGDLQEATASMGTAEQARVMNDIFGQRAIGPANILLQAGAERLREYRGALEGAEGAASDMAATMRDTTTGDINSLKSAVEGIKIAIFETVKGPLREMIQSMTAWARENREIIASGIQGFVQWLVDNLPEIAKWGRRIAVIASVFLSVAAAVKVATAAVAFFNAVSALNPWTLIAMAIIAAIALVIAFWPEISEFFQNLWQSVRDVAQRVGDWFSMMWNNVRSVWEAMVSAVGSFIESVWEPVKAFLVGAFEFMVGIFMLMFGPIIDVLKPLFGFLVDIVSTIIAEWDRIKLFFQALWTIVKNAAVNAWNSIMGKVRVVATAIRVLFTNAWEKVATKAQEIFDRVKGIFEPLASFFSELWDGIAETFSEVFGGVVNAVGNIVRAVRSVGRDTLGTDDEDGGGDRAPQVVSPQERTARTISETTTTSRGEVVIRDESGRAEVRRRPSGNVGLTLEPTGAL